MRTNKEESKLSKSKHNYTQYSNKKNLEAADNVVTTEAFVEPEVFETTVAAPIEPAEIKMVNETVETVVLPEIVTGVVVDCAKLNIRVAPNATATVACVLNAASEIEIDVTKSTDEWFHVCTAAGIEGYCMRKFVEAHL